MQTTCGKLAQMLKGELRGEISDNHLLVKGVSTDTRTIEANQLYVPLVGERFDGHDFLRDAATKGAAAALWQADHPLPGSVPLPLVVVEDTLRALQELAARHRQEVGAKVVAVTGSNGKTTTKDLIGSVLSRRFRVHRTRGNLNNHVGLPLTLLSMPEDTEIAVVEMGMNHTGEIAALSRIATPDVAVITNIGDAHLEHLGSREAIAEAKLEIREGLSPEGTLVFNGDDPLLRNRLAGESRRMIRVGLDSFNDDRAEAIEIHGTAGISFISSATQTRFQLPLLGRHNAVNALLAVAVGRLFGLTEEEIGKGLEQAKVSGMRLELCEADNGMTVINDAYNASPTSMRAGIDLLLSLAPGKEKWVLLGDMLELGPKEAEYHRKIGAYAAGKGVSRIYTAGERGKWIAEGAKPIRDDLPVHHFETVEEAVRTLRAEGGPGVMLLVKASRGLRLNQVVEQLAKGAKKS